LIFQLFIVVPAVLDFVVAVVVDVLIFAVALMLPRLLLQRPSWIAWTSYGLPGSVPCEKNATFTSAVSGRDVGTPAPDLNVGRANVSRSRSEKNATVSLFMAGLWSDNIEIGGKRGAVEQAHSRERLRFFRTGREEECQLGDGLATSAEIWGACLGLDFS